MEHTPMKPEIKADTTDRAMTQQGDAPAAMSEDEFERRFPPGHPVHEAVRTAVNRWFSDIFSFWCLCDRPACRRAGCCKGDPSHCVDMFRPLLPDDVHDGGVAVFEGRNEGLSFDQVLEHHRDDLAALHDWNTRLEQRAGARRKRGQPKTAGNRA
jgi:hypothetical protein